MSHKTTKTGKTGKPGTSDTTRPAGAAGPTGTPGGGTPPDPTHAWREGRDAYLDAWAKAMVDTVNTEAYAQTTGVVLDSYLTASSPFREAVEKSMLQALHQLSMPTRADVTSLAERLTNIEVRLDDLDAKLNRIADTLTGRPRPTPPPAPRAATSAKARRPSAPSASKKAK